MSMYRNHRQPPRAWVAWLDGWSIDMQARGMSGRTVESYWYRVTNLALDCRTPPRQVTAEQIQAWIIQATDPTTRAGRRAAVNEFYKWAVRMGRIRRNPVDRVPPVRRPKRLAKQPASEESVARGLYAADEKARSWSCSPPKSACAAARSTWCAARTWSSRSIGIPVPCSR